MSVLNSVDVLLLIIIVLQGHLVLPMKKKLNLFQNYIFASKHSFV